MQSGQSLNGQLTIHGTLRTTCRIRNVRLVPGRYQLHFQLKTGRTILDDIRSNVEFEVLPLHDGTAEGMAKSRKGVIVPETQWDIRSEPLVHPVATGIDALV